MHFKVVLVIPPIKIYPVMYPMGLGYMAAILKQEGYDIRILNYSKRPYSLRETISEIVKIKPDFIGINVFTFAFNIVKKMTFELKKSIPLAKVIIGGPHVSALAKFSLEETQADFAVVGEGERVTLEIIKRLESASNSFDDIKGLAFWKNGKAVLNPGCNLIYDLDNLPFPMREPGDQNKYGYKDIDNTPKRLPAAPILTSRGCPYRCTFCCAHVIHGRGFRKRLAQSVVDEIEFLVRNHGVKEIDLLDIAFSEDRQHALGICEEIIRRNLDIVWRPHAGLRLDTLDDELLEIFKVSGCYEIGFGIESVSDVILNNIRKPLEKSGLIDKIRMIKNHGISTSGYFILGLPEDTDESIRRTIKFARDSDLDHLLFSHIIPFPGTEIFDEKYKDIDLHSLNWDDFHYFTNNPFSISELPREKLKKYLFLAYFLAYITPKRIIKALSNFISNLFNIIHFLRISRIIYHTVKNLF